MILGSLGTPGGIPGGPDRDFYEIGEDFGSLLGRCLGSLWLLFGGLGHQSSRIGPRLGF